MYISCQLLAISRRKSDISNIFYIFPLLPVISGFNSKITYIIFLYSIFHSTVSRPAGYVFYILILLV